MHYPLKYGGRCCLSPRVDGVVETEGVLRQARHVPSHRRFLKQIQLPVKGYNHEFTRDQVGGKDMGLLPHVKGTFCFVMVVLSCQTARIFRCCCLLMARDQPLQIKSYISSLFVSYSSTLYVGLG